MSRPLSSILRTACLLGLLAVPILAQTADPTQPGNQPSYLLRLERNHNYYEGVCVLLRGDGQYHLEEQNFEKVRVFEGNIDPGELRTLIQIVSGDQLLKLDQKQITDPMLKSDAEQLRVSILRPPNLWQELNFTDSQSREPYRQSLSPLMDWLNRTQKREGRKLSEEEGRNNCNPPKKLEFSVRPAQIQPVPVQPGMEPPSTGGNSGATSAGSAPQLADPGAPQKRPESNSFVLRMLNTESIKSGIAMSCTVVSHAGAFHFVKQSRDFSSRKIRSEVLDGNLTDRQVTALVALLAAPALAPPPSSSSFYMPTAEGTQMTVIIFWRDGLLQKFEAWRGAQFARGMRTENSPARGMDALVPLWQWLKINLDESKAVPSENPQNAKCWPELQR